MQSRPCFGSDHANKAALSSLDCVSAYPFVAGRAFANLVPVTKARAGECAFAPDADMRVRLCHSQLLARLDRKHLVCLRVGELIDGDGERFHYPFACITAKLPCVVLDFRPILKKAELPQIRLYDLRHSCATLLLMAEENPKVVSERLGHSTVVLTLDTYSHVLPTMQRKATEKLEKLLYSEAGTQRTHNAETGTLLAHKG